jgi:hypothetical protein
LFGRKLDQHGGGRQVVGVAVGVLAHLYWPRSQEKLAWLAAVFLLDHVAYQAHGLASCLLKLRADFESA